MYMGMKSLLARQKSFQARKSMKFGKRDSRHSWLLSQDLWPQIGLIDLRCTSVILFKHFLCNSKNQVFIPEIDIASKNIKYLHNAYVDKMVPMVWMVSIVGRAHSEAPAAAQRLPYNVCTFIFFLFFSFNVD